MFDGQSRQVRLVEPVDGDAAFFDTIPPELGLSAWGDFPIVGHGGGALIRRLDGLRVHLKARGDIEGKWSVIERERQPIAGEHRTSRSRPLFHP